VLQDLAASVHKCRLGPSDYTSKGKGGRDRRGGVELGRVRGVQLRAAGGVPVADAD
jgi:hypothetical protein